MTTCVHCGKQLSEKQIAEKVSHCPSCNWELNPSAKVSDGSGLAKALSVFGIFTIIGGIILGASAAHATSSGENALIVFITLAATYFFASLAIFWMARVIKNQKLMLDKLDKLNQNK